MGSMFSNEVEKYEAETRRIIIGNEHVEKLHKIANTEAQNIRDDNHKKRRHELDREVLNIYKDTSQFFTTIISERQITGREATFALALLQCFQPGNPADKEVVMNVFDNVPLNPSPNLTALVQETMNQYMDRNEDDASPSQQTQNAGFQPTLESQE